MCSLNVFTECVQKSIEKRFEAALILEMFESVLNISNFDFDFGRCEFVRSNSVD